jgi:tetratricopeptide (TPR) repeat protein
VAALAVFSAWYVARPGTDPRQLLEQAWDEFGAGRYDRAAAALDRRARRCTPTARDWALRALLAQARGRIEDALVALRQIPDADPLAARAWLQAGSLEFRRGRAPAAEAALLHALKLDPKLAEARRELAYLYALQLRRRDCNEQYRALAELIAPDVKILVIWCQIDCSVWQAEEVRTKTERFVQADPGDRWSRLALAESLRSLRRLDEAEVVLGPLAETDPDARAARARLAWERGDIETAEARAAHGPDRDPALERLRGQLALARRDGAAAIEHFRSALRADLADRDVLHGLGLALRLTGAAEAAATYLRAAEDHDRLRRLLLEATTRNDPATLGQGSQGPTFTALGRACEAAGYLAEARGWYLLAIARDPLDDEAQRGLGRLGRPAASRGPPPLNGSGTSICRSKLWYCVL